ncbi:helix-hairpin-helix domain-containing protein [Qipengyuania sphaerica]|uniref:helix-hairpin-helix domain-containing protein n=1 Tax=Qipengyuania sphaerica TaxID=2867243 RepID=UPI001FFDE518|nr:helix-hairpin-helix domain-containing protein [Qipengyuania sphaerica]
MRKFAFTALAASAIALAACSGAAGETADETTTEVTTEAADESAAAGVIDASTATADELAAMEGMTEELAAAIVAGQPYESASAFNAVLMETLSEEQAAAVREKLFVPVNLNTASEADIKLIPGMTPKMEHEFMEYRPYADMDEFDREIGKYVDAEEVARFRQYVTL